MIMGSLNVDTVIGSKVPLYLSVHVPCIEFWGQGGMNSPLIVFTCGGSSASISQSGRATTVFWAR